MKKLLILLILATTVLAQNQKSKTLSVVISPQSPHTVTLNWHYDYPIVGTYNIYRKQSGDGSFTRIKTGNTTLTYTDTSVVSSMVYEYMVTAQTSTGLESVPSNTVITAIPNP
jgi:fibronectin type 3 domain-containing protein